MGLGVKRRADGPNASAGSEERRDGMGTIWMRLIATGLVTIHVGHHLPIIVFVPSLLRLPNNICVSTTHCLATTSPGDSWQGLIVETMQVTAL